MAEIVRIALNTGAQLKWPSRCPRCGTTDDLLLLDAKVVRNNAGPGSRQRSGTMLLYTQESIRLPVLMCRAHAHANQAGGALLGRDVKMIVLRASIYVSLLCGLASIYMLLRSGLNGVRAFGDVSIGWWLWCLYGVAGVPVLAWARQVAWVRPLRLDPHYDIAILSFKDAQYARDFKRTNAKATTGAAVDKTPIWRRMTPMKALLVICAVLLGVAWWMGR